MLRIKRKSVSSLIMPKPNILMILSDEHDPAVTGCYGDPLVETPHLDGLASRGITFDACYCNSPLCVPSRLSLTTGKYISRVGAWNNECRLPAAIDSLPRALRRAGYEPYLCGKQHYATDRRYGFTDILPEGDNHFQKSGRGGRLELGEKTLRHGKQVWERRSSEFHPGEHSKVLDHDRKVTERVLDFLETRNSTEAPYFLFAGYLAPHFPLIVPEPFYEKYRGKVPPPQVPEGYSETLLPNYQALRQGFGFNDLDPAIIQKGRDLYWALTDWFDQEVGKILGKLAESEEADNTIVIYTSDHGENKGDHGLWWKNCMYESSARVPLIVSWPARWAGGQRRSQVCSLVDLVQTVVELAGGSSPEDWDGDSLVPLLDSPDASWKDLAVSQYYAHHIVSGMTMIREGNLKYIYHSRSPEGHPPEVELFDLHDDPGEFQNLALRPEYGETLRRLHQKLVDEVGEDPEQTEQRCRVDLATGYEDAS